MDYYKILELNRNASEIEIRQSYRRLCLKYHPDKGGTADQFKLIAEAYEVLSDPIKKLQFDQKFKFSRPIKKSKVKESVAINDPNLGMHTIKHVSPKNDIWGQPIEKNSWIDATEYENDPKFSGQPYLR